MSQAPASAVSDGPSGLHGDVGPVLPPSAAPALMDLRSAACYLARHLRGSLNYPLRPDPSGESHPCRAPDPLDLPPAFTRRLSELPPRGTPLVLVVGDSFRRGCNDDQSRAEETKLSPWAVPFSPIAVDEEAVSSIISAYDHDIDNWSALSDKGEALDTNKDESKPKKKHNRINAIHGAAEVPGIRGVQSKKSKKVRESAADTSRRTWLMQLVEQHYSSKSLLLPLLLYLSRASWSVVALINIDALWHGEDGESTQAVSLLGACYPLVAGPAPAGQRHWCPAPFVHHSLWAHIIPDLVRQQISKSRSHGDGDRDVGNGGEAIVVNCLDVGCGSGRDMAFLASLNLLNDGDNDATRWLRQFDHSRALLTHFSAAEHPGAAAWGQNITDQVEGINNSIKGSPRIYWNVIGIDNRMLLLQQARQLARNYFRPASAAMEGQDLCAKGAPGDRRGRGEEDCCCPFCRNSENSGIEACRKGIHRSMPLPDALCATLTNRLPLRRSWQYLGEPREATSTPPAIDIVLMVRFLHRPVLPALVFALLNRSPAEVPRAAGPASLGWLLASHFVSGVEYHPAGPRKPRAYLRRGELAAFIRSIRYCQADEPAALAEDTIRWRRQFIVLQNGRVVSFAFDSSEDGSCCDARESPLDGSNLFEIICDEIDHLEDGRPVNNFLARRVR